MGQSTKHREAQYQARLAEIVSHYNRNKNAANSGVVLGAIPTKHDADSLSKLRGQTVSLHEIFKHMGTNETRIYALRKEKHLESAEHIVKNLEITERDMLDYCLENLKEHLEEAGFGDNYDAGLSLINASLKEIKKKLVWNYMQHHKTEENKNLAEKLFSKYFPNFFESSAHETLKPHF